MCPYTLPKLENGNQSTEPQLSMSLNSVFKCCISHPVFVLALTISTSVHASQSVRTAPTSGSVAGIKKSCLYLPNCRCSQNVFSAVYLYQICHPGNKEGIFFLFCFQVANILQLIRGDYMSTCKTLPCSSLPFWQEKVILSRDKLPSEELCTRAMNICKDPPVKCQDLYQCAYSTVIMVSRLLQHQDPQQCKYTPDSPERKCGIDFAVLCCTLMDLNDSLLLQTAWQKLTKIIYFSSVIKHKAKLRWSQTVSDESFS